MTDDTRGLPLTAANGEAVTAFDHTIDGYLGLSFDTGERLKATFAADPGMPMAYILKGYFFMLMAMPALKAKAQRIYGEISERLADATPREQRHAKAMDAMAHGRANEALNCWEDILAEHPRDALALRLAHHGYFYKGDSQNLRDVVVRNMHAWDEATPGFGYVMGMWSFGLEETHAYGAAIDAGEKALNFNPVDPWAIHAVAHVHEMADNPADGIKWITTHEPGWLGANNFRYHLWWHRALMRLDEGDYDTVLAEYDQSLWDPKSDEYLDLCNDASLLMRLELHGVDVGGRWADVAEKCKARTNDHLLAFIDVHFALTLAAIDAPEAGELYASLAKYGEDGNDDNAPISAEIGKPLAAGLIAYKQGDFGAAVDYMVPVRYALPKMGGSNAQRDLFAMILLDAAIRAGRANLARALAAERLGRMPENAWTRAAHTRAFAA